MDPDTESKIRELDAEILAILEECIAQGRTKEEINFVFAPLNHPKLKMKTTLNITDIVGGAGESLPRPDFRNSTASLRHYWSSASLRKVIGILFCLLVAGFVLTANEEKITNLRFHALAVMRIALIKVLPYWNWTDMYYTRCLVRNPFYEAPNLNVDDCYLCESQEEIRRISNVSQTGMMEDFVRRERPCIVTDSMEDWHIMNTDQFWFDNITEVYLKQENYRVCNVNTNLRSSHGDFTRVLKRLYNPHTQEWFIHWENCQKDMAKLIRQFYKRPYFIPNFLDFTGSNWILMSSDFKGRVYKKIETSDSLVMLYQIRGFNHVRLTPRDTCRGFCPELSETIREGEILVVTNLLWMLEYIPGEDGDNLAILSEVSWPSMD